MNIDIYKGFAVNVSSNDNSWNHGLVCDKPRFERTWEKEVKTPMKKSGNSFVEITLKEAKEIIEKHKKNLAIVLDSNVTNDEAKKIKTFAEKHGLQIAAIFDEGQSTAKLANIFTSKRIKLEVELTDYPLLKPFIHIAKKQGAIITNENYDIAIVSAPAKEESVPTIVMHKGLNEAGLKQLGFDNKLPKAESYLIVGTADINVKGFKISMGYNKNADLILPLPAWISRSGKIINLEGRELEVKTILKGISILDILSKVF
ncbi:MAG: hypothetical protein ACFFDW_05870, partial [Candidatus Thorarchaeota archaeon]